VKIYENLFNVGNSEIPTRKGVRPESQETILWLKGTNMIMAWTSYEHS
jgi:hypothetical protein